jgi:hypothetical protein
MDDVPDAQEIAPKQADQVIERLGPISGIDFGRNEDSVVWVDGFIEQYRQKPDDHDGLIVMLGCFLGECIVAEYGGRWVNTDRGWAIRFDTGDAYPIAKVASQFDKGVAGGESIYDLYRALPAFAGSRRRGES